MQCFSPISLEIALVDNDNKLKMMIVLSVMVVMIPVSSCLYINKAYCNIVTMNLVALNQVQPSATLSPNFIFETAEISL